MQENLQGMWDQLSTQLTALFGSYIPNLVGAMAILVVGWLVALVIAAIIRGALSKTTLDHRLSRLFFPGDADKSVAIRQWTGKVAFSVVMLFVLVAVFQTLQLTIITEPLNRLLTEVFQFLPRLLGAAVLLGVAWILATLLKRGLTRVLQASRIDERLGGETGAAPEWRAPLVTSIAEAIFWLVFLLFLPAVLGALALEGLLEPVKALLNKLLGFLPSVLAAGLILVIGWFIARILQRVVSSLLAAAGLDRLGEQVGLAQGLGTQRLSGLVGLIVYILILIPVLIAALNALALNAITEPASRMLGMILGAIPALFAATLVLVLAYVIGRTVSGLVTNLLEGIGFNTVLARIGLVRAPASGATAPSAIVGSIILVVIMLFAAMEAASLLGFALLSDLLAQITVFGGHLLTGVLVLGIGLYLANLAASAIQASGMGQAGLLAKVARIAIVVLTVAMALRQMGLADDIVNLAFGLSLGALAVGFALAIGLGGREVAATELRELVQTMKSKKV